MTKPYDILLDSDVVRHFLKGGQILLLPKLYPDRLVMLDKVKNELCRSRGIQTQVENFLNFSRIKIIPFPSDIKIVQEYARLRKELLGEGESACMAFALHHPHIIASSNLKDIRLYCEKHKIQYLPTMEILFAAHETGLLTQAQCDLFIYDVISKGSILPCKTMEEYISNFRNM